MEERGRLTVVLAVQTAGEERRVRLELEEPRSLAGLLGEEHGMPVTIGRTPDREVQLLDKYVARSHARIYAKGGRAILEDHRSAGGTYVNERRIDEHVLRVGDVVRVGQSVLRVEGIDECGADGGERGGTDTHR